MAIQRIRELPANWERFAAEIAADAAQTYGPRARAHYLAHARRNMQNAIAHPAVHAYAATEIGETRAFLLGIERDGVVQIPFLHVLAEHADRGLEAALLREAVPDFRDLDIFHMLCETVVHAPLDLAPVFSSLGFEHVPRQLMLAPVPGPARPAAGAAPEVRPLQEGEWNEAAACLVAAYAGDPGRRLHAEMLDEARAGDFIARVHGDSFGKAHPEYLLVAEEHGACAGVALGCEAAPGTGFLVQAGVRPAFRGRGVATALIRALDDAFMRRGLGRMGLGVTCANPARRLYERLGFSRVHPIDAYTWWKPGSLPRAD